MAKWYGSVFVGTSSDPADNTGLTPTLVLFWDVANGTSLTPPGITETPSSSGFYMFSYGPTVAISFKMDGGAALSDSERYVSGILDPIQIVDQRIGTTSDSFGSTSVDPTTVLGYLKRDQEFNEGDAIFTKSTGVWDIYSRGSSTLLTEKTLTNTSSQATKS